MASQSLLLNFARSVGLWKKPATGALHQMVVRTPDGQARTFRFATETADVPAQVHCVTHNAWGATCTGGLFARPPVLHHSSLHRKGRGGTSLRAFGFASITWVVCMEKGGGRPRGFATQVADLASHWHLLMALDGRDAAILPMGLVDACEHFSGWRLHNCSCSKAGNRGRAGSNVLDGFGLFVHALIMEVCLWVGGREGERCVCAREERQRYTTERPLLVCAAFHETRPAAHHHKSWIGPADARPTAAKQQSSRPFLAAACRCHPCRKRCCQWWVRIAQSHNF